MADITLNDDLYTEGSNPSSGRPRRTTRKNTRLGELSETLSKPETSANGKEQRSRRKRTQKQSYNEDDEDVVDLSKELDSDFPTGFTPKAKKIVDKANDMDFLLTNPKSILCNMDISELINIHTWSILTPESKAKLCKLLPRTAFNDHPKEVDAYHPSRRYELENENGLKSRLANSESKLNEQCTESMEIDDENKGTPLNDLELANHLDQSFFTDAHFLSAAHTFQDHLFTGWYTESHRQLVEQHLESVYAGNIHAPWKDEVWAREHENDEIEEDEDDEDEGEEHDFTSSPDFFVNIGKGKQRAKTTASRNTELIDLVKTGGIKVGDVLAFKKHLSTLGMTLEKDALVKSINPKSNALTLLSTTGPSSALPSSLLLPNAISTHDNITHPVVLPGISTIFREASGESSSPIRSLVVTTPGQLEMALAALDGRIARNARTGGNAWKCISVWRWPSDWPECAGMTDNDAEAATIAGALVRGGRELYGTLNYLRGSLTSE